MKNNKFNFFVKHKNKYNISKLKFNITHSVNEISYDQDEFAF